jgi:hypothetical protein
MVILDNRKVRSFTSYVSPSSCGPTLGITALADLPFDEQLFFLDPESVEKEIEIEGNSGVQRLSRTLLDILLIFIHLVIV